ncbi:small ribosomal subunit Rsm22 family protein [Streptomyces tubbatahanensis]|uniref:Small ribosomal subunit Rsm22 family protein n=1 Tax=Streptomyces tubbatahanensis TaxID=2923272 RepID=A0ABY3Y2I0_9ACTN|nr:small ribosomal subunit Rsm22 family protein [Streptomyces tubbatahanensis]UNT00958.1 small ribosomal subunit Rsm22 family protein [Streptomyces tubbatahanensis]
MEQELRGALAALVDGLPARQASAAVERLIGHYRGETPTGAPVLRRRADAVAYAAYRMPATFAAASAALDALAARAPDWAPASHLDIGGGTGAAVWAAAHVWETSRTAPRATTVLDWAEPALALGRELASSADAVRETAWRAGSLRGAVPAMEPADLVTASYVLGELDAEDRRAVVDAAARAARGAVVLVEPGTPDGYLRIREARDALLAAGLRVLAPCPHGAACPLVAGQDWCHFAVRVARSSLHRRVKGGELAYEDEKYSYVAAVRDGLGQAAGAGGPARVVRKPLLRKGQVLLDLCAPEGGLTRRTVTKRDGADTYRAARKTDWGGTW